MAIFNHPALLGLERAELVALSRVYDVHPGPQSPHGPSADDAQGRVPPDDGGAGTSRRA